MHRIAITLAAVLSCATWTGAQGAGEYDATTLSAGDVLPADMLKAPGFEVADRVSSNGHLNEYKLNTDWGDFTVVGTDLLRVRIHEIAALKKIEKMKQSDVFLDAAEKAAASPLNTAKALIDDPADTISQTGKGVGTFVSNVGSSLFGKKEKTTADENTLQAAVGFYAYKRKFAYELDVDPYTTFEPLQTAMTDICWTGFAGGMTVKAAFMAVPGGAGIALSTGSSAATFKAVLRDKTPQQLQEMNKQKLEAMSVSAEVTRLFLRDESYPPTLQTLLVSALEKMDGCSDRGLYVEDAISAHNDDQAFYVVRRAVLHAGYHLNVAKAKRFLSAGSLTIIQNEHGAVVAVFPADRVLWTAALERGQTGGATIADGLDGVTGRELWVARDVSPRAMKNLKADGWDVHAEAGDRLKLE